LILYRKYKTSTSTSTDNI